MRQHFDDLFNYDHWANQRAMESVQNFSDDDRVLSLLSHLASAKVIWLNRVEGLPTTPFPIWEKYKLNEIKTMLDESHIRWKGFINKYKVETFEEVIHYTNSKGKNYESTLRDIILQVINHGTYHRGQVAVRVKELGGAPAVTDYIYYKHLL